MRFIKWYYKDGSKRVIKRFTWFPIKIYKIDYTETRWLEIVYILQVYREEDLLTHCGYWYNKEFVNSDEYYEYVEKIKE